MPVELPGLTRQLDLMDLRERRELKEQTVLAEQMEQTDLNALVGLTEIDGACCQV